MRPRTPILLAVAAAAALGLGGVAQAIVGGVADANAHPYVADVTSVDAAGHRTICSGFAVRERVVVTAAHCFAPGTDVSVSFDPQVGPASTWHTGAVTPDPDWHGLVGNGRPGLDTPDLAVVTLDDDAALSRYATLADPHSVDLLPNDTRVDTVGYGVSEFTNGGGTVMPSGERDRIGGTLSPSRDRIGADYLKVNGDGSSGTCAGDSGGPVLLAGTDTVIGIQSFVIGGRCNGVAYSLRADLDAVHAFVEEQ